MPKNERIRGGKHIISDLRQRHQYRAVQTFKRSRVRQEYLVKLIETYGIGICDQVLDILSSVDGRVIVSSIGREFCESGYDEREALAVNDVPVKGIHLKHLDKYIISSDRRVYSL